MEGSQPSLADLQDRRQKDVAAMLGHFKALVNLAAAPVASKEAAAAQALEMAVHSSALVERAETLLQLTRELKELWIAGPLKAVGEREGDDGMAEDASEVGEMVNGLLKRLGQTQTSTTGIPE